MFAVADLVLQLLRHLAVRDPVPAHPLLADSDGAGTAAKRVNDDTERLREQVEEVVHDANVAVAEVLGLVAALAPRPDIVQRRLPLGIGVGREEFHRFWKVFHFLCFYCFCHVLLKQSHRLAYLLLRVAGEPRRARTNMPAIAPGCPVTRREQFGG